MRRILGWTSFAPSGLLSRTRGVGLRMCSTASDAPKKKVRIRFLPEDVVVDAEPGECILDVAERGNVHIASSCGVGDCGTCEIEMLPHNVWIRSCVAKVPSHKDEMSFDVVGSDIPAF
ncbi:hypothetical protein NDN08_003433 [Rhodosorus marinus]|uniref:2Fe-2S ferredoxin-type domain-containing protein n=1 Tax=Rhodosorus marinus TaxID=101924 RepID=A0AAV8UWH1_9RHOD|nr:hypothetical protein NDN08_003433 [Rhodosorus marinus]